MSNFVEEFNLKDVLCDGVYSIPMYQRNYAWGYDEIIQLLQDSAGFVKKAKEANETKNYYVGTLVVCQYDSNKYEVIDGQQRLTTITLIMMALLRKRKNINTDLSWYKTVNLNFDMREKSNYSLQKIFYDSNKDSNDELRYDENKDNEAIWKGFYKCIKNNIDRILEEHDITLEQYVSYFLNNIKIIRVEVPSDTDLNHYFEIMNSRGQQLEQHEIVKARLMAYLHNIDNCEAFNKIWEACSSMNKYVHFCFIKEKRIDLFTDEGLGILKPGITLDKIADIYGDNKTKEKDENSIEKSLVDLFKDDYLNEEYNKPWEKNSSVEESEKYSSIINFPNFLLHVLKIFTLTDNKLKHENKSIESIVSLDDKTLLQSFQNVLAHYKEKEVFVQKFILTLLKIRTLFDLYIIKRYDENWTLRRPKYYGKEIRYTNTFTSNTDNDGSAIIMAQSMFHVSSTSQIYKNWLFASLLCLYTNYSESTNIAASLYLKFFNDLAKAYMLDHYLAKEEKSLSFDDIIITNSSKPTNSLDDIEWHNINIDICEVEEKSIRPGETIENFVFNCYDYILWQKLNNSSQDFSFGYRNSVEHFYPQHPVDGEDVLSQNILQSFGNLCIVSSSINSKFSNNMPGAKFSNFGEKPETLKTYSLKLRSMFDIVRDKIPWSKVTIIKQEQEAKIKISDFLKTKSER